MAALETWLNRSEKWKRVLEAIPIQRTFRLDILSKSWNPKGFNLGSPQFVILWNKAIELEEFC